MNPSTRHGLTLVEMLAVIAIVGLLVTLLMPALQSAREASRRATCANNLKQTGLALAGYESTNRIFPPGRSGCDRAIYQPCMGPTVQWATSFFVLILPHLEQQPLHDTLMEPGGAWRFNATRNLDLLSQAGIASAVATQLPVLCCPSDSFAATSILNGTPAAVGSYAGSMGSRGPSFPCSDTVVGIGKEVKAENTGIFMYGRKVPAAAIRDGLSQTLFVGEVVEPDTAAGNNVWTVAGRHLQCLRNTENPLNTRPGDPVRVVVNTLSANGAFQSRHPGGCQFVFGDGHTSFIEDGIGIAAYRALSTRDAKLAPGELSVSASY